MTEGNSNGDLHKKYAEKYLEMKELEEREKQIKSELKGMEALLIEKFAEEGIAKLSLAGGITLRLDVKIWPKVSSPEAAVAAIKATGMKELLTKESYQVMTLASFLRELDKSGEELPPEFVGVISPNPVYKIVATRY